MPIHTILLYTWAKSSAANLFFIQQIVVARTAALAEYQSSAEFEQVRSENFDEGVRMFIYNISHEHPEWDLSFLGEAAREMVAEFNAPPGCLLLTLLQSSCL